MPPPGGAGGVWGRGTRPGGVQGVVWRRIPGQTEPPSPRVQEMRRGVRETVSVGVVCDPSGTKLNLTGTSGRGNRVASGSGAKTGIFINRNTGKSTKRFLACAKALAGVVCHPYTIEVRHMGECCRGHQTAALCLDRI